MTELPPPPPPPPSEQPETKPEFVPLFQRKGPVRWWLLGGSAVVLVIAVILVASGSNSAHKKYPVACNQVADAKTQLNIYRTSPNAVQLQALNDDLHQAMVLDGGVENFGGLVSDAYLQAQLGGLADLTQAEITQIDFDLTNAARVCPDGPVDTS